MSDNYINSSSSILKCFEDSVNKNTYKMFKDAYSERNIVSIDLVYTLCKEFDYINTFYFFDDYCTIDTSNDLSVLRSELYQKQVMQIIIDHCPDFTRYLLLDNVVLNNTVKLAIKVISKSRKKEEFIENIKSLLKDSSPDGTYYLRAEEEKLLTDVLDLIEKE
jgi:hypothetical protein